MGREGDKEGDGVTEAAKAIPVKDCIARAIAGVTEFIVTMRRIGTEPPAPNIIAKVVIKNSPTTTGIGKRVCEEISIPTSYDYAIISMYPFINDLAIFQRNCNVRVG